MGAKTWMLAYSDGDASKALLGNPELDREASLELADRLFPGDTHLPLEDETLTFACPPRNELLVGCYPGISIVAADEFGIDFPSKLDSRFVDYGRTGTVTLHAMHSVVDWFAFARWEQGSLVRALSISPDSGVIEDIGTKMDFEISYWNGEHSADDDDDELDPEDKYPLPFHPLDLGEQAVRSLFGYMLEGFVDPALVDSESIKLMRFKRVRKRWWQLLK